jgi:hypothetical protein
LDKKTYYVSLQLGRVEDTPFDHTYLFKIAATDVEVAILQEKLDQMADSELWFGILAPVHKEADTNERRHESQHLMQDIYEMIDDLEVKPVRDGQTASPTAHQLSEWLNEGRPPN